MLQDIRDRASGWIAWVVIILIAAAFALFGLSNYMGPGEGGRAVASVDGVEISRNAVGQAYRTQRQQVEQLYGDDLEITDEIDQRIRRQALEQLVNQRLLANYMEERNMALGDQDLAAVIRSQEVFQENGRFSRERYEQLLRANQISTAQYEQQVRRDALIRQLRSALGETGLVTEREVDDLLRLQSQERDLAWLRIDAAAWRDEISVGEEDLRAYYEDNQSAFVQPDRVRLAYVELTRDRLLDQVEVTDEEVAERYEQVRDARFTETPRVEARHILVQVDEDAGEDAVAEARTRIESLRSELQAGASFAELAREHSEDPGSARRGGDLGAVEPGDMVEPFEEALFALDEGELSEPVRSPFGFHIIQATEVTGGDVTPLDAVRDELRREIAQERINTAFVEAVNRLDDLAYDMPDSLDGAADAMDLEIRETDWIPRGGTEEGPGSFPAVLDAAFSGEVLDDRLNSAVIEVSDERAMVVRVREHQPEQQRPLEAVRAEVESRVIARRTNERAEALAEELMARLEEGADAATLAADDERLAFEEAGWVGRSGGSAPRAVVQRAFRLPPPGENGVGSALISDGGGDPVLVIVRGVREGDPTAVGAEQREQLVQRLRAGNGEEAIRQFMAQLRSDAEITIHDDDYR